VGFAIPRIFDLYGWIHEPAGMSTRDSAVYRINWMNWTGLTEQLANTEEIENGKSNGALGEVFIRCNNVLYIG
jgi:hypothetical protein